MAQVEVGLGAVVGDVDLAVLIRAHRARVDVDVRVELLQRDAVAVAFEQRADRGGRQALAERRHDAAGHEDVFHGRVFGVRHCVEGPLRAGVRRQQAAHPLEIFRRVHADGIVPGFERF